MSTDVWKKGNETMNMKRINNNIKFIVIMAITFIIGAGVLYSVTIGNTRTTTGTYSNGTIETEDGNVWKVSNYNGIATNKTVKVTVKFDTKGTDSVLDDEIIEIKEK